MNLILLMLSKIKITNKVRVISIFLVTVFFTLIFMLSLNQKKLSDSIPQITHLPAKEIAQTKNFSQNVKVGIYINSIPEFKVYENSFKFDLQVWFEYDPAFVSISQLEDFSFFKGDIIKKSVIRFDVSKKHGFITYDVILSQQADLKFENYPYDSHVIPVILVNNKVQIWDIVFYTQDTNFNIDPFMTKSFLWQIDDIYTDYGYENVSMDKTDTFKVSYSPLAMFVLFISNLGIKNILIIFIPLFIYLFISLFVLLIPAKLEPLRLTLTTGFLAALVAFRFILMGIMPKVGDITIADKVYLMAFLIGFGSFLVSLIENIHLRKMLVGNDQENEVVIERQNTINFLFFLFFSFCSLIFLYQVILFK